MHEVGLVLGLLLAVTILSLAARKVHLPYPTVMVIGGLAICFIPRLPTIRMDPDLFFLLFLPPLLYSAAWQTSWRDFRSNLRPIMLLAVGFVVFTTFAIAWVAHVMIDGMAWPAAFALGAIISPPDAVAAIAIAHRLGLPRRIVTVLEGESLVNDATGLTMYRVAVAAAITGSISFGAATGTFVAASVGSALFGLFVGWVVAQIHGWLEDPLVETVITLLTPFAAFIPPELFHVSGVLAVVTAGLYVSRHSDRLYSPGLRVQALMVWQVFVFVLNGLVFVLIGLQLPTIVRGIRHGGDRTVDLLWWGFALSVIVIFIRMVWVYPATYVPRWISRKLRERDPAPSWKATFIIAYTGMRGADSLAAALALPLVTTSGAAFPRRNLIIFLTFSIILFTLVVQSLSLPPIIKWLGLREEDDGQCQEWEARLRAVRAAVKRIEELAVDPTVHIPTVQRLRTQYGERLSQLSAASATGDLCADPVASAQELHREALAAERELLINLRDKNEISDEVLRRILRDLDLEELRLIRDESEEA